MALGVGTAHGRGHHLHPLSPSSPSLDAHLPSWFRTLPQKEIATEGKEVQPGSTSFQLAL